MNMKKERLSQNVRFWVMSCLNSCKVLGVIFAAFVVISLYFVLSMISPLIMVAVPLVLLFFTTIVLFMSIY